MLDVRDSPAGSPLTWEDAGDWLVRIGRPAVPALTRRIATAKDPWWYASVVASIGHQTPELVEALRNRTVDAKLRPSARNWSASALVAIGWADVVLAEDLPVELIASAMATPYRSLVRPTTAFGYGLLEDVLSRRPDVEGALEYELRPGSGSRDLRVDDVEAAFAGLTSRWPVIRWHAMFSLRHAPMNKAQRQRFWAEHERLLVDDPSGQVREFAGRVQR